MFSVLFEVHPRPDQWEAYLGYATMLRPELERIDGFVDNIRYRSLTRDGWILSLSGWRDEKALVRWRTRAGHHEVQQRGRDAVMLDYHLRVGQVTRDSRVPAGHELREQRLDETETGAGTTVTLVDGRVDGPDPAARLGLDEGADGLVGWDVFDAVLTPGNVILRLSWRDEAAAEAYEAGTQVPDGARRRRVRIVRDYGMYDRRESPQYYPDVTPVSGDVELAAVGALVGDPGRCRILLALDDGRALPASRLAAAAGVSAATASSHLGKLTAAGLLAVEARGRHRYYRLAGPEVAELLEALQRLAPVGPVRSLRQGTRAAALREARTCYDHVAGRLGVALMAALIEQGHLTGGDGTFDPALTDGRTGYGHEVDYRLSPGGSEFMAGFGVRVPPHRRLMRYCVDWSEQRHHLAGGLGRGLHDRLHELDWVRRTDATRALRVTGPGRDGLRATFGLDL